MTNLHAPMQPSKLQNYNSPRGAEAYKADYQNKLHRKWSDKRERALLTRYFAQIGHVDRILDLPSGHGRLSDLLHAHCKTLIEGDWSFTMVSLNKRDHGTDRRRYCRASALEIPLPDGAVDVAVSFRLSHHLETQELRERHLRELFRVAKKHVIVTWFSATSLKNMLRQLRVKLAGKKPKNVLRNERVRAIAQEAGFRQTLAKPLFLIGSGHVLGLFTRT
ncbi:MAG: class I SAM-dependent methyltransferase [Planctomycetes bacterium]|nr:class I SAM-dependent methyltransferase [Planctomycetota bacterium]